jgi:hypothetical protein
MEKKLISNFKNMNSQAEKKLMTLFKSFLSRLDKNEREHELLTELYKHFSQDIKKFDQKLGLE